DVGPMPHGGEGGLDRVAGAQMDPVLGRVVVERQQLLQVVGDLGDRRGELRAVGGGEGLRGGAGVVGVLGVPDFGQGLLRPGWADLGSAASTLAILWNQQRCSRVAGKTSRSAAQNPKAPSPAASIGARMPG